MALDVGEAARQLRSDKTAVVQCADGELGNGVPPAGSNTSLHACGNLDAVERVKDPNW